MKISKLLWKIPLAVVGVALGVVVLVLIAVTCFFRVPALRTMVVEKGIAIAAEQTGMDIEVGQIYISFAPTDAEPETPGNCPLTLKLAPRNLYRAYKGEADLPLTVLIDSVFLGHRGQDTLACVHTLRLNATVKTNDFQFQTPKDLLAVPIQVARLLLSEVTFCSGSLIESVGLTIDVGHLALASPELSIAQGKYPLQGLQLYDTFVGVDLRPTAPDTAAKDTTPMRLAFDVPDGDLRNIHFLLTPTGLDINTRSIRTNALINVGGEAYDARHIEIGPTRLAIADFTLPIDTFYGDALVDLKTGLITSMGLNVRSDEFGAQANLSATRMNLESLQLNVEGEADFRGSKAQLKGFYDINRQAYDLHANIEQVNLAPFLQDSVPAIIAGQIDAEGMGFDINSRRMRSKVNLQLTDAIYDNICASGMHLNAELANKIVTGSLHLPFAMTGDSLQVAAQTEHQFRVADFTNINCIGIDYHALLTNVQAHVANRDFRADSLNLNFATDSTTSLQLATKGLDVALATPMHVMRLVDQIQHLTAFNAQLPSPLNFQPATFHFIDSLRRHIPDLNAGIALKRGSPIQHIIEDMGLDINHIDLTLNSTALQTDLVLNAAIPDIEHPEDSTALRLPAAQASARITMKDGYTFASVEADTKLTDGAMAVHGLKTDVDLWLDIERNGYDMQGAGCLMMDDLVFGDMNLGSRTVDIAIAPSDIHPYNLRTDVQLDDIPLKIASTIINMPDLDLNGSIRAQASIDGLPEQFDLSAEVLPLDVAARYVPYDVQIGLGETPIVMKHNKVDFNGLPIYAADSTYLALTGGLDLNSMKLDITLAADSFAPVKLVKDGPIPVHGELATDIHGTVTGALDSIVADVTVAILPTTDITYPIDKKNLAQVKPHGEVNIRYSMAEDTLLLGGQVNVDDGFVRYSPKAYPIMPFHVDSGSHVAFNGPIGQTYLNISASQKVKADVESEGEETRRVQFNTGVRVNGVVDSIGFRSIGFFLEAPDDETITNELAAVDEETREGLAATLLATGMYVGESNVAAQRGGYALSSIINSRINAAMVNSKVGKVVDIDFSTAQTEHVGGKSNDFNIAISKSFFKDRLRITLGSSITDNPDVNVASGLLSNLTAEYKLTKEGNVLLRIFAQRDYNNVFEGDLYKSGVGVRAIKEWQKSQIRTVNSYGYSTNDTIIRTYNLTADADVAWRSNNSLGPNLTLTSSVRNLMGRGETFSLKGNGAYYWALRNRHPGDPKKTDTYKLGVNASLLFPYLHWLGDNNPEGDTRYMVGYQYENIAGGYGVHKVSGSLTYFIRTSQFITHAFTPFSLSFVHINSDSTALIDKAASYPQLLKVLVSDEFVPSIGYNFIYNDYRAKRVVNTSLDIGVKEAGNIINGLYCLFGHKWNEQSKPLGNITFNQFVKFSTELRNRYNITDRISIATRIFAGANLPIGNSQSTPLSEAFYAGGPNNMRAASPYAYGPGNFYSEKYNQNFFHSGDIKLEANFEFRFPIVWKIFGATFVDAGNVWNWDNSGSTLKEYGFDNYMQDLQLREELYDGIVNNPYFARQIALGTGFGLRLDYEGLVVRLDIGVAIHTPYQTYKYTKDWKPDYTQPINTYFNIPSALDAVRVNFGIGYPF